jgi:metallo-beta-lactamase class B
MQLAYNLSDREVKIGIPDYSGWGGGGMKFHRDVRRDTSIWSVKLRRCLLLQVVLLIAVSGFAQTPNKMHGTDPVKPFRVIGNIYYVGVSDVSSFLVTTPEGDILLDSTYEDTVPGVRKSIEQLGFHMRDIKILLNSHAHSDHLGGHKMMKELTGAQVVMSELDAPALADGGRSSFDNKNGTQRFQPMKADRIIHEGDEVRLGGTTLVARLTPGHTKGCTTWTMVAEDGCKNYNVAFICSLPGPNLTELRNSPTYPNVIEDSLKSFAIAKSLPVHVFLGSHAAQFGLAEKMKKMADGAQANPFIDPQGYRAYVEHDERRFKEALEKARTSE